MARPTPVSATSPRVVSARDQQGVCRGGENKPPCWVRDATLCATTRRSHQATISPPGRCPRIILCSLTAYSASAALFEHGETGVPGERPARSAIAQSSMSRHCRLAPSEFGIHHWHSGFSIPGPSPAPTPELRPVRSLSLSSAVCIGNWVWGPQNPGHHPDGVLLSELLFTPDTAPQTNFSASALLSAPRLARRAKEPLKGILRVQRNPCL
jgi:hypothetical protein